MLKLDKVSLGHGAHTAVHELNLRVDEGELVVLLGAHGAGKTTTLQGICGQLKPSAGHIVFNGQDLAGLSAQDIVMQGVVHCPQERKLFASLSVLQNLVLGAYVHRRDRAGIHRGLDEVFALFPVLATRRDAMAGSLSGGQQQMVAIGRALMSRPKILLLDEPSRGLAPLVVKQVLASIQRINQSGVTVLLAEQNARSALQIAHRGYVMEEGRAVLEGPRDALVYDNPSDAAYIGA